MKTLFFKIAINSLHARKGSVLLTLLAIIVSVYILLGVEHIREQAKQNFNNTISGTDLIVGARTGDISLLLYSVFQMGNATQNISWPTYQKIANLKQVKWAVPISLGDSHKGYRVTATNQDYFKHYHYGELQSLQFTAGRPFSDVYDVVLGAEVARRLHYQLGDKIILAHGLGKNSFTKHKNNPFKVVGILDTTGTPIDRSLYIGLVGMEAIHIGWSGGGKPSKSKHHNVQKLTPDSITCFLLGLNHKMTTFRVQRQINTNPEEALLAVLPGVALSKLWKMTATVEKSLQLISVLVVLSALLGLVAMLLASIRERQREIAVMRAMGATPLFIFMLIEMEVVLITSIGSLVGMLTLFFTLLILGPTILSHYGLSLSFNLLGYNQLTYLAAISICAMLIGVIPAIMAYKQALNTSLE